jgi:drug/metabolite transporter (DMT)-like permease
MIQQAAPPSNPLLGAGLIAAVWGAVVDWRYKRKGGKKPSKKDRLLFLTALVLVGATLTLFWLVGGSQGAGPEIAGEAFVPLTVVLFGTWELGRWKVRRKYPLPTKLNAPAQLNTPPRCSKCGQDSVPSAKFCPNCGNTLTG